MPANLSLRGVFPKRASRICMYAVLAIAEPDSRIVSPGFYVKNRMLLLTTCNILLAFLTGCKNAIREFVCHFFAAVLSYIF